MVSWTSTDSRVVSLPLRTLRIMAEFDVRGVSFSKGNIAAGSTLPSSAVASAERIAGSRTLVPTLREEGHTTLDELLT